MHQLVKNFDNYQDARYVGENYHMNVLYTFLLYSVSVHVERLHDRRYEEGGRTSATFLYSEFRVDLG